MISLVLNLYKVIFFFMGGGGKIDNEDIFYILKFGVSGKISFMVGVFSGLREFGNVLLVMVFNL